MNKYELLKYKRKKNTVDSHTNQKILPSLKELMAIISGIGFIVGNFILNRYFDINNISQQPIDTSTILITSLSFLVPISFLSTIFISSNIYMYTILKQLKDKHEIPNLLKYGLIRLTIFYSLMIIMSYTDTKYHLALSILLIITFIILVWRGVKYIYTEDKFFNHTYNPIIMSMDIIFPMIPLIILSSLFIVIDKDDYESLFLMFIISFIFFSLPYIYMLISSIKSNIIFTIHIFSIAVLLLFIVASTFFTQRTIQLLNIGVKPYSSLILDSEECKRLSLMNYKNLGYTCDENNTLKDMFGIWLLGDKPIFEKLKYPNSPQIQKADKNSTKIWLYRDKIQSVL